MSQSLRILIGCETSGTARRTFAALELAAEIADSQAAEARMNGDLTGAEVVRQIVLDIRAAGEASQ